MNRVIASSVIASIASVASAGAILLGALAGCDGTSANGTLEKCKDVVCATGQTCNASTGVCEGTVNKCANVTCSFPQSCETATGACVNPPVPSTSGTLMARMGRAGVNTVLTNPFDAYTPQGAGAAELSDVTKDRYNRDGSVKAWPTAWAPAIQSTLAIFDGLDNTCGNQIAYGALAMPNHTLLSVLLAGDALQVDTSQTTCSAYLAAERKALGATVNDCGGRKLDYDVVDVTYQALTGTMAATDGIAQGTTPDTTFPFFKPPV